MQTRIDMAEQEFENGNYAMAAAQYDCLYNLHPDEKRKEYFLIQKGWCLYRIDDFVDAQRAFEQYLEQYPEGQYADKAGEYLTNISVVRRKERKLDEQIIKEAEGDIQRLEDMLTSQPYNAQLHYELANTYWKLKKYDKAAKEYLEATQIDAALKENELVQRRLTVNNEGRNVPLTPELRKAKEHERNPLVIFDVHDYSMRQKRDVYSARHTYILVAGKVRNQSSRLLRNVVIETTFFNVHREMMDVKTYRIGTMGPGDVRGFVVQSSFADDISNVYSYDTEAFYE